MRHTFILLFLPALLICANSYAQPLPTANTYRDGDRVRKQLIEYKNIGRSGENVLWDLGEVEVKDSRYTVAYRSVDADGEQITGSEHGTAYRYRQGHDTLWIAGFENRLERITYDRQEAYLRQPISYGDSLEGYFHGRGAYCDKALLRSYGHYLTKADACGKLILPDGDTLCNVVRLRTERLTGSRFYPADSVKASTSLTVLTEDSVKQMLTTDKGVRRMEVCRWYAAGYRYPVLETVEISGVSGNSRTTAFYCPPDVQEELGADGQNERMRAMPPLAGGNGRANSSSHDFNYNIHANVDGTSLGISCYLSHTAKVSYALYTINGGVVTAGTLRDMPAGIHRDIIPVGNVRQGIYILDLQVDGQHYADKVILGK